MATKKKTSIPAEMKADWARHVIVGAFEQIGADLAESAAECGEESRIHVDDAADAVSSHLSMSSVKDADAARINALDLTTRFAVIVFHLKLYSGGKKYIYL
jgi:hypothetical protein